MAGIIRAVCISTGRGTSKTDVGKGNLIAGHGIEGDGHTGTWRRQVSMLPMESIRKVQELGLMDIKPGDFAENLTIEGLNFEDLTIGKRIKIGSSAIGEVTQIGKECHRECEIRRKLNDCIMPREGVFLRIHTGGPVQTGDPVEVL
ncbi:MAG TPA: MOSC domain-containing protein [Desulfotomaculum sp.]|nr:MAG: MOSC domain containing protein [Desulfotomaculum sp. 46_80]KUK85245.1 MAG: MOSC domain containing protein [Desulfofundulus kuznetsovii]HAG11141.1 MOSC domain-containing protein [Desulfotomaculum sp.]HBY03251.1 MOSC domain-containing protein [Desulfotomaculum sp.]